MGTTMAPWKMVFTCGYDYFGDLDEFGLTDDLQKQAKARIAWAHFGARFMRYWDAKAQGREAPWAFEQFGAPTGWRE